MKWKTGATDLDKRGFESIFNEKYNVDIDENDSLIVTDKQGKEILNPKKAGVSLSFAEVLEMEGITNDVWMKNPHAQNNKPVNTMQQNNVTPPLQDNGDTRTPAPRIQPTRMRVQ